MDLEGVVAKRKDGIYADTIQETTWVKIKNPEYTQALGRHELFQRRRAYRLPGQITTTTRASAAMRR